MTIEALSSGNIHTVMSHDITLQTQHDLALSKNFTDNDTMQNELGQLFTALRENAFNSDSNSIKLLSEIASKLDIEGEPDLAAKAASDILRDVQNKSAVDSHRFNTLQDTSKEMYQLGKQSNTEHTLPKVILELALNAALDSGDDATVIDILNILTPVKQSIPNSLNPIDIRTLSAEELDRAVVYVPTQQAQISYNAAKLEYTDHIQSVLTDSHKPEAWLQKMIDRWESQHSVENFEQTEPTVKASPKAIEYSPLQTKLAQQEPAPQSISLHIEPKSTNSSQSEQVFELMVGQESPLVTEEKSPSSTDNQSKVTWYNPFSLATASLNWSVGRGFQDGR